MHTPSETLRFGIGLNSFVGGSVDYGDDWAGRYHITRSELLTVNVNPSVALRLTDRIAVGLGIDIMFGRLQQEAAVNNRLDTMPDGEINVEDQAPGFGFNVGFLAEIREGTRVGVTYRSPVHLDFEDVATLTDLGPGLSAALDARGLIGSEVDLDLTVPQAVMVSVHHELTDRVAVMANVGWQNWERFGESDVTVRSSTTNSLVADPWSLSAGFAYDSSPISRSNRTPDLPLDRQLRYAGGVQYDLSETMTIGLAYEYVDMGSAEIDLEGGVLSGSLAGEFETNALHVVNVTLVTRF